MKYARSLFWSLLVIAGIVSMAMAHDTFLGTAKAITKVPTTHKVTVLTFDDGPHPHTTLQLLAVLKAKQVKATFFVLGSQAEKYPGLLAEIAANGHEIESHGYTHHFLNKLSQGELAKEIEKTEKAIGAVAPKPTLIRPPGGGYNDRVVAELSKRGYTTILWTIDPRDWCAQSADQIIGAVIRKIEPGSIVLLHEGACARYTPEALGVIIDRLQERGYTFITVSELLQYYEIRH
ncbi:polysaccharide deacetylase [Thermosinus carboxydivorans Nor1]|uniref:Polysaccharide deacetylase n=1 Tax=Thermosinus carboxydivorans Nor1 TaxID=401526 RepID=A1HTJ0_9FIRM|nr:polysaccharide deacetylase family protein [Thermosinus carboxydivorans]EAX46667.1 polysaccharide deacetylase [Thermosinus carboxydivorans Nor1]